MALSCTDVSNAHRPAVALVRSKAFRIVCRQQRCIYSIHNGPFVLVRRFLLPFFRPKQRLIVVDLILDT